MTKYINEETLRKLMYEEAFEKDSDMQKWDSGCWIRYKLFENCLEAIPDADVVEVRHERWDLAKDPFGAGYVKCSRCGYKHCPEYCPDGSAIMHLFCPSCGAKMDGGQDDDT